MQDTTLPAAPIALGALSLSLLGDKPGGSIQPRSTDLTCAIRASALHLDL